MFHLENCDDPDCLECYWTHAGDIKEIFRQGDGAFEQFCDDMERNGIMERVWFHDQSVYLHRSVDYDLLGRWRLYMYYLPTPS